MLDPGKVAELITENILFSAIENSGEDRKK